MRVDTEVLGTHPPAQRLQQHIHSFTKIIPHTHKHTNLKTGMPYYHVIVWNDARTRQICEELKRAGRKGIDRFRAKTGLPISNYFSATKILWLLENVPGLRGMCLLSSTTYTLVTLSNTRTHT